MLTFQGPVSHDVAELYYNSSAERIDKRIESNVDQSQSNEPPNAACATGAEVLQEAAQLAARKARSACFANAHQQSAASATTAPPEATPVAVHTRSNHSAANVYVPAFRSSSELEMGNMGRSSPSLSGDATALSTFRPVPLHSTSAAATSSSQGFRPISAGSGYGSSDHSPAPAAALLAEYSGFRVANAATHAFRQASAVGGACPVVAMKETIDKSSGSANPVESDQAGQRRPSKSNSTTGALHYSRASNRRASPHDLFTLLL